MKLKRGLISSTLITLAITATLISGSCNSSYSNTVNFKKENKEVSKIEGLNDAISMQKVFRQIAETVMPATVNIYVESEVTVQNPYAQNPFFNDPFFKRFFDAPNMDEDQKRKMEAQGSGVIVSPDGYLFSNYHVVKNATKITVLLSDNREFKAKLIGTDPETDIAILKIEGKDFPYAAIGDSDEVQVGDWAIAIGNPFGLAGTFTVGFVSAMGRPGMMSGFQSFIQTDTAVNPGNSGGPLVNIQGQVIGINTAIQSRSGGFQGISFAVPINTVINVAKQIIEKGSVERGFLGIYPDQLDETTRKHFKLNPKEGVIVSKVVEHSPAEKSGIQQGDIITKINGKMINDPAELQRMVGSLEPQSKVNIEILRNNDRKEYTVTLSKRTEQKTAQNDDTNNDESPDPSGSFQYKGVTFSSVSSQELNDNGASYGVKITDIDRNSPFAGSVRVGEILVGINNTRIKDIADLKLFADAHKNTKSFTLRIIYKGYLYYRGIEG